MNRITTWFVVAAGGLSVFCTLYLVKAHRKSEERYEALRQEMEEFRQASTSNFHPLRAQIVQIAQENERAQRTPTTTDMDESAPSRGQVKPAEPEMSSVEMAGKLRNSLASEQKDPGWSTETEGKLSKAFSKKLEEGTLIRGVDCRSTMCVVELQYKTFQQFRQFIDKTLLHNDEPGFWGPAAALVEDTGPSGEVSAIVALAREGHELPSIKE